MTVAPLDIWSLAACQQTRSLMTPSRLFRPSNPNPLDLERDQMFNQATSPSSSPSTLLSPSMSPGRSGRNSRTSRPRPLDSPSTKPLLYLLNLTTNIAVSMLEIGTHTRTSPSFSTLLSRNTTGSCLLLPTPLTWTLTRSRVMLPAMFQFTLAALGLAVPLMDSVSPLESPRSSARELKPS